MQLSKPRPGTRLALLAKTPPGQGPVVSLQTANLIAGGLTAAVVLGSPHENREVEWPTSKIGVLLIFFYGATNYEVPTLIKIHRTNVWLGGF